jgi:hypothetical protein
MRRAARFLGALIFLAAPILAAETRQEHPGEIALIQNDDGSLAYRLAANGLRIYVNDRDSPGKSTCNGGCSRAWIPLAVNPTDLKPIGEWTIIIRDDGSRQWAYKGRPVYSLFHDSADRPIGEGIEGVWHLLEP